MILCCTLCKAEKLSACACVFVLGIPNFEQFIIE